MFCLCVWVCVALLVLGVGFLGFSALSVTFLASVLYTCTCTYFHLHVHGCAWIDACTCMHACILGFGVFAILGISLT